MRVTTRPEERVNKLAANSIRDVPAGCDQQFIARQSFVPGGCVQHFVGRWSEDASYLQDKIFRPTIFKTADACNDMHSFYSIGKLI